MSEVIGFTRSKMEEMLWYKGKIQEKEKETNKFMNVAHLTVLLFYNDIKKTLKIKTKQET